MLKLVTGAPRNPPASPPVVGRCRNVLGVLTARERQIIVSLRLSMPGAQTPAKALRHVLGDQHGEMRSIFSQIAALASANALDIFSPASLFVSEDELAFISRLSQLQRPSQRAHWSIDHPFMMALQECAALLEGHLGRLPPRRAVAEIIHERSGCFDVTEQSAEMIADSNDAGDLHRSRMVIQRPTTRARALEVAKLQPIVRTAQFGAVGVSRQYIGSLCKSGYLERVSHGHYRLARRHAGETHA